MARARAGDLDTWQVSGARLLDHAAELWEDDYGPVASRLLTSATRCYAAKGFQATTTRDISRGAGLSPAAMYVHFSSKEELLYEISRRSHLKALEAITPTEQEDPADSVRRVVRCHVVWHALHHVAARVSQYELANLTPTHYEEVRAIRRATERVYHGAVERGIDDGVFADQDVTRVVRGIIALAVDLVRWYRLDDTDTPEELGAFYAELALAMLSATVPTRTPAG